MPPSDPIPPSLIPIEFPALAVLVLGVRGPSPERREFVLKRSGGPLIDLGLHREREFPRRHPSFRQAVPGPRARLSHTWDGINFFRGSGGLFFIKGNQLRTWRDLSRDIGGFLPFPLRSLAIPVRTAPCVEVALRSLDFIHGKRDHLGRRAKLAHASDEVRNAHASGLGSCASRSSFASRSSSSARCWASLDWRRLRS